MTEMDYCVPPSSPTKYASVQLNNAYVKSDGIS